MYVQVWGLPSGVSEDDLRGLLDYSEDIQTIEIVDDGDPRNVLALIELNTEAAAEGVVELLQGRRWKNKELKADKVIFDGGLTGA